MGTVTHLPQPVIKSARWVRSERYICLLPGSPIFRCAEVGAHICTFYNVLLSGITIVDEVAFSPVLVSALNGLVGAAGVLLIEASSPWYPVCD